MYGRYYSAVTINAPKGSTKVFIINSVKHDIDMSLNSLIFQLSGRFHMPGSQLKTKTF